MNSSCGCGVRGACEKDDTYAAQVIVVLLLLYLMYRYSMENYIGQGLNTEAGLVGASTSGATLRRLGQIFSSTNQGVPMTIYNADLSGKEHMKVLVYPIKV